MLCKKFFSNSIAVVRNAMQLYMIYQRFVMVRCFLKISYCFQKGQRQFFDILQYFDISTLWNFSKYFLSWNVFFLSGPSRDIRSLFLTFPETKHFASIEDSLDRRPETFTTMFSEKIFSLFRLFSRSSWWRKIGFFVVSSWEKWFLNLKRIHLAIFRHWKNYGILTMSLCIFEIF